MFIHRPVHELITSSSYFIKTADVIIEKVGDKARAVDRHGNLIAEGSLEYVFEEAKRKLSSGRGWVETIVIMGNFEIEKPLKPESFLRIVIYGYIKVKDGANCGVFEYDDENSVLEKFEIVGGVLDGNGYGQTSSVFAVINIKASQLKDVKVIGTKVINAYAHGIYMSEYNPSNYPKLVEKCYVYNVAVKSTGYGIYLDYAPKAIVRGNYVEPVQQVDAIEVGHGDYIVENNTVVGGTINFPYADKTIIASNVVINGTIQNDGNTANNILVIGNKVLNASPAPLYAGIRVVGNNARIIGNYVEINNNQVGIKVIGKYSRIIGNHVVQLNPTQGIGIRLETHYGDVVIGNIIDGFDHGIDIDRDFTVVEGNTIRNCNTGVYFVPTSTSAHKMIGCRVINNVFENVTTEIDTTNQLDGNMVENMIYGSIPTYNDGYKKGDVILYYDGTYYYLASFNGSSWLKVQLS